MRTLKIKLYKFNELTEEAKKVAIQAEREYYNAWSDPLFEFGYDIEEKAKEVGFHNVKARYTLSHSQGDGLSFSCNEIDLDMYAAKATEDKEIQKLLIEHVKIWTERNNGHHAFCSLEDVHSDIYSDKDLDKVEGFQKAFTMLEKLVMDAYKKLCRDLEKLGYDLQDNQDKDETIIERINQDDEYEFTANGKRFYEEDL